MTIEHVSVPRDELEEIARELSKYEAREVAYYARHFGEELQAILSRATPSDDCYACEGSPGPANNPCAVCGKSAKQSGPRVVTDWIVASALRAVLGDSYDHLSGECLVDAKRSMRQVLESFATSLPAAMPDSEVRLWDTQWMNIVNHDNCYRDWSKDDAIAHAVKMTEQAIARNVADGKLPPKKTAAAPQAGES